MRIILFLSVLFVSAQALAIGLGHLHLGFSGALVSSAPRDVETLEDIEGLDVEMDFDATYAQSYSGSGSTWVNLVEGQPNLTVSGPTFTGDPDSAESYWDVDADEFFYIGDTQTDETQNPDFVDDMVNSGQDSDWWIAYALNIGDADEDGVLFGVKESTPDWSAYIGAQDYLRFTDLNGTQHDLSYEDGTNSFKLLPNQNAIIIFSYDDSADTLYTWYNYEEAYSDTLSLFHTTDGAPGALHIFGEATGDHDFSNARLYAVSAGQGLVSDVQAAQIVNVYNTRHPSNNYTPEGADCSNGLYACIPGVNFEFYPSITASYSGSGSTISNIVPSPFDGADQSAYEGDLNSIIFGGESGTPGAHFLLGESSYVQVDVSASTPGLYRSMDGESPYFSHSWCAMALRTPFEWAESGTQFLMGSEPIGQDDQTGWGVGYSDVSSNLYIAAALNGTSSETHNITSYTLSPNTDYFIMARNSPVIGFNATDVVSQGVRTNSTAIDGISNNFESAAPYGDRSALSGNWLFGNTWNSDSSGAPHVGGFLGQGARIYAMSCGSNFDTPVYAEKILAKFELVSDADLDNNGTKGAVGDNGARVAAYMRGSSYVSTGAAGSIDSVVSGAVMDLRAYNTASYPGSGQVWTNLTGDTDYDFYLGNDNSENGNDPTFNSASPSYFSGVDDFFGIATEDTGPAFLQGMGTDEDFTLAVLMDVDTANHLFTTGDDEGAFFRIVGAGVLRAQFTGVGGNTIGQSISTITTAGPILMIISHDATNDVTTFWIYDGTTDEGGIGSSDEIAHADRADITPNNQAQILARGSGGESDGDLYAVALWNVYFSNANAIAVRDFYETETGFDLTE